MLSLSRRSSTILLRMRSFATSSSDLDNEFSSAKPFDSIPSPSIISMTVRGLPGGKYHKKSINDITQMLFEEYGQVYKFGAMMGNPSIVMTSNPADFEKIFRVEGTWPERFGFETLKHYRSTKRPEIYAEYEGLITSKGEKWQKMRSLANPILMQPKTVKAYTPQVNQVAQEFVEIIKTLRDEKSEMPGDFIEYVNNWSLESVGTIALEKRLNVLSGKSEDGKASELVKLVKLFFQQTAEVEGKPPLWRYYETKPYKELTRILDDLTDIILQFIKEAKAEMESKKQIEGQEEGILRKFLRVNEDAAVAVVSDFLIAGVDTTSSAVINNMYCLAKNPEKQQKLREEVMQILPSKDSPLTAESMKNMPYLRACMKEAMRLYPVVNGNIRKISKDIVVSGYRVPANVHVAINTPVQHKNPEQFYEPDKFIPERWLRNNDEKCPHARTTHEPFVYLPFGFGSRMCIGKRLAELEMEVLLSKIVRNFKLEWHHEDMKTKDYFINLPISEMRFKFELKDRRSVNDSKKRAKLYSKDTPQPYPNGWFGIEQSMNIKPGQAKSIDILGKNFVVFRSKSNEVFVLDAYCPHMGANLGVGGNVSGDCIECPFHAWKFSGETGECVDIPYSESCDDAHLATVHDASVFSGKHPNQSRLPTIINQIFTVKWWPDSKQSYKSYAESQAYFKLFNKYDVYRAQVDFTILGPGIIPFVVKTTMGEVTFILNYTPIDAHSLKVMIHTLSPFWLAWFAKFSSYSHLVNVARDQVIFNAKQFKGNPLLVKEEKVLKESRNWYSRFYSPNSKTYEEARNTLDW